MIDEKSFKVIKGIKIDPIIFTFKFGCRCSGECCYYGVYTDIKEYKKIINVEDKLLPLFDESQTKDIDKWFEKPETDEDFESGIAIGTELHNNKCVFLDKNGLCSLQKLALKEGEHKWKYKPLYCILFPLTIYEGILMIDDEHMIRLATCNNRSDEEISIFDACRDELKFLFGEDGFAELEACREEYLNEMNLGVKLK